MQLVEKGSLGAFDDDLSGRDAVISRRLSRQQQLSASESSAERSSSTECRLVVVVLVHSRLPVSTQRRRSVRPRGRQYIGLFSLE